jgi:hypothetical protein
MSVDFVSIEWLCDGANFVLISCRSPISLPKSGLCHGAGRVLVVVVRGDRAELQDKYTYVAATVALVG